MMRRSDDVGEWLVALGRSDDARAELAAEYAAGTTHLDAPTGGPFEVFLSARPQEPQPEPQPEPQTEPQPGLACSNVQALLELSSSSSESDDELNSPEDSSVYPADRPTSWPQRGGRRTPRHERKWWRDPLPRRSLFAADTPLPPRPPEPEPEPPTPLTRCTCQGHGVTCSHDRRFLLPERAQAEQASIEQRFGLCVHTVRFPRCNMRAAVTLAPGEMLQIRLGTSALTKRDPNIARNLTKSADLWRLHGRVDTAVLRRSSGTDSTELHVFTALSPRGTVDSQWTVSTRVALRCLRSIGGPAGYAWVDVTITPLAKRMRESQPSVQLPSVADRGAEESQAAARRHQARLLGVFKALDHDKTGHVSLTDLQIALQHNRPGGQVSIREIRSFLEKMLGQSVTQLDQISFGQFVKLVAGLPIPIATTDGAQQTRPSRPTGRMLPEKTQQRASDQAGEVKVALQQESKLWSEPELELQTTKTVPEPSILHHVGADRSTGTKNDACTLESPPTIVRVVAKAKGRVLVEAPHNDVEFSAVLNQRGGFSSRTCRHLVLWTARWLPCARTMRHFFRRLAERHRTENQYPEDLGKFVMADISECPVAAQTVAAVPFFACYDNMTRVTEFEFAGENVEALELSVSKALVMPTELQRQLALELVPEIIESLLQHVMDRRQGHDIDTQEADEIGSQAMVQFE